LRRSLVLELGCSFELADSNTLQLTCSLKRLRLWVRVLFSIEEIDDA
jgi:hypothetical protein